MLREGFLLALYTAVTAVSDIVLIKFNNQEICKYLHI